MNKTTLTHRFAKGLHLFVIAALLVGLALGVSPVSVAQAGQNGENGEFAVSIFHDGMWQTIAPLSFGKHPAEKQLDLCDLRPSGEVKIRIDHSGNTAAHIDALLLGGKAPRSVVGARENAPLALKKVARRDYDLIDAQRRTLTFTFDVEDKALTLSLTARIEPETISKVPFQFPLENLCQKLDASSSFYTYALNSQGGKLEIDGNLENENLGTPFFKAFIRPGTGHPPGFTYGWVRNDDENLYVAIDLVPDNTMDGDKDYAKVHVNTQTGLREFKVSVPEQTWGVPGFVYTNRAVFQHKVYEFQIPFSEIRLAKTRTGETIELAFEVYGTLAQGSDFGDAPEGGIAYPPAGATGAFPTCMTVGPPGHHIQHNNFGGIFGPAFDIEPDGNAGLCPTCFPTYDDDECFQDGDAGLMMPEPYTIMGTLGSEYVAPCPNSPTGTPLGITCQTTVWGVNVDIEVHNHMPEGEGYVNVLMDWNQDGQWGGTSTCPGGPVREHVLVNFPISNPYDGPLSNLGPLPFTIGPNPGYVWTRFSITEGPVPTPSEGWNGEGDFEYGETEDYLLEIEGGTIIIEKQTDPDGAGGTFAFTDDIGTPLAFNLGDDGIQTFTNVVSGTYGITETNPAPTFDLTDITCSDDNSSGDEGTGVATVSLQPGEVVTCTFTNTYAPPVPVPVGGFIVPVDKLGLLAPWMGFVGLAALATLKVALLRRRSRT